MRDRYVQPFNGLSSSHLAWELVNQGRDAVVREIDKNGGVLLLRFGDDCCSAGRVQEIFSTWAQMDYTGGTNDRDAVSEGTTVLTVGGEPIHRDLPFHQEMAYATTFPAFVAFACLEAPRTGTGGESTVASAAGVLSRLPEPMQRSLETLSIMHRFTFGDATEAVRPWQDAFDTNDREEAIAKCIASGYDNVKFNDHGGLTCTSTCSSFVEHPRTGKTTFFQTDLGGKWYDGWAPYDDLPFERQPYSFAYGDGTQVEHCKCWEEATKEETWDVAWERGDIMIIDNLVMMHGRRKYEGRVEDRKLGVVLLEPYQREKEEEAVAVGSTASGNGKIWCERLKEVVSSTHVQQDSACPEGSLESIHAKNSKSRL